MAARLFMDTVRDLRNGGLINDLEDELKRLVQAVTSTGKRGELKLTLGLQPATKGHVDVLMLDDKVDLKLPKTGKPAAFVFPTADGGLSRKDPRQPELNGLREVPPVELADFRTRAAGGEEPPE